MVDGQNGELDSTNKEEDKECTSKVVLEHVVRQPLEVCFHGSALESEEGEV